MNNLLVSGYRAHELNIFNQKHEGIAYIKQAITNKLLPLIDDGLQWVITPGQYGVDLWACEAVIALKPQYPQLRLSIITAYSNPEEKWKDDKKEYYEQVLKGVDYYASVSDKPYDGIWQLQARDELLFRKTDGILLVYDEDAGEGSPRYFKERALRRQQADGYRYISISSDDIQSIADEANYRDMD
ncbi:Uncharacterized SPBc2 prophage-derived protein YoqJ [Paenibacillus algorifonticola]|uniref:Uncharacterized SPBc2 prophage-derived protein YoqJ n=1 Tax=Paenibacillus algorifonticola TaxID=684063 RepID=A0A1I2B7S1_9BACL|nr:DUF1273 domain-containing protein [Paenibacillus algorifonticola]SFE52191.1 Uncharacterized SPBc2 prophage-derived protein YoqJ [Paenibacillus algorifonticola]